MIEEVLRSAGLERIIRRQLEYHIEVVVPERCSVAQVRDVIDGITEPCQSHG